MEDKLVTLAILTYAKAQILKNVLENEGIETYIHNVNQIQPVVSSGVRVRIKESDLPHALKITESSAWLSEEVVGGKAPKRNYNSFIDWNENLIELFSIGQAKNMTKLFEFLDGKLKFPMNYVRITNEPLSAEHMRNISMDNASDRSLKILQSIGNATAIKAKMDPKVERFFTTGKTLYF